MTRDCLCNCGGSSCPIADGVDPGRRAARGGGVAGLAVVVAGEQLAEKPGQRRVDGVPRITQVSQQAGFPCPVQHTG